MKFRNTKFLMLATVAIVAFPVSVVMAASTNFNTTALFRAALTLAATDMDFSAVDYVSGDVTGGTVSIATDGTVTYDGAIFTAGAGAVPVPGLVDILTGQDGFLVDVSCDTTATMANALGDTINVVGLEVAEEGAEAAFGLASACAGVGVTSASMTVDIGGGTGDLFTFGGQIDGTTASSNPAFVGGAYSSVNAGGDDVQVDVVYQ